MSMSKKAIYWWYLRDWASWVLGGFVVLAIGGWIANFMLDSVGAGAILRNIVYIILLGGCVLLPVQRVRTTWPPTEHQAKKFKKQLKSSRNKSNEGGGSAAGAVDDDWPIEDEESDGIEGRGIFYEMVGGDDETDDDDDSGL